MLSGADAAGIALSLSVMALPFGGAILVAASAAFGGSRRAATVALATSALTAGLVAVLYGTAGLPFEFRRNWIGDSGVSVGVLTDSLSVLFAALISAVSLLSLLYSQRYIRHEVEHGKLASGESGYYGYMLLFTGSMLGMVFSADLIQLYVFWELTGVASFLLIGINWTESEARRGAVKALVVTALGGLAMLVGFILLGTQAGSFSIGAVLESGATAGASVTFALALILVVIGAASKSAQVPFHIWLPDAMVAPSPVSAFLHSAALVAAGVYLLARLHPLFAGSPLWQWSVTGVGTASVLVGGILALKATEIKRLLAYSTISQYGFIFALLGYGGAGALAAAMFSFLNHGLIKAGLFLSAGTVTYATGNSELGANPGLWRRMPVVFATSVLLALSLGGAPSLAGFWMKEVFIAETLNTHNVFLVVLAVVAGALTLVYMLRFAYGTFVEGSGEVLSVERPPASMLLAPALLAALTLTYGLAPSLVETTLVEPAAAAIVGRPIDLDLTLHIDLKLLLSLVALTIGAALFATRRRWGLYVREVGGRLSLDRAYAETARGLRHAGSGLLRLQSGQLPAYVQVVLLGLLVLVLVSAYRMLPYAPILGTHRGGFTAFEASADWAMIPVLSLIAAGTVMTFTLARHIHVIVALSAVGYLIAAFFALEYAPDVGLVQVHVETLVTVLFVIALVLIPKEALQRLVTRAHARVSLWKLALAGAIGLGSAWFSWLAMDYAPPEPLGVWFNENSYELTHAADVVAAILVDFRALDTLGEITVFAIATVGVSAIIRMVREEH